MKPKPKITKPEATRIASVLAELVGEIPESHEEETPQPERRARAIAKKAAVKAAAFSGMLAIPPGPLGIATIIPDLVGIWRLQRQMVADIAGVFGTAAELKTETMVYCLFKHGGAALTRDLVVRAGERILIQEASVKSLQIILSRIGVNISERIITKSLSRFIPLVGALGLGAYAYYDTTQVAVTTIDLFRAAPEPVPPLLVN